METAVVGVRPAIGSPHSTFIFSCLLLGKTLHPSCLLVVVRGPSGAGTWQPRYEKKQLFHSNVCFLFNKTQSARFAWFNLNEYITQVFAAGKKCSCSITVWGYCPIAYWAIQEEKLMAATENLRIRSTFQSGNNNKHTASDKIKMIEAY